MRRQTARLHRLDAAVRQLEMHAQIAVLIRQRDADIPIEQPQRAVVAADHHRPAPVPAAEHARFAVDQTGTLQPELNTIIQAGDAERPFTQRAQHLKRPKAASTAAASAPSAVSRK